MNSLNFKALHLGFKPIIFIGLCTLTFVGAAKSVGEEVEGLYQATVPISGRSDQARAEAVRRGFAQVITKITGSSSVVASAGVRERVKAAAQYVNGYSYQSIPGEEDIPELLLSISYSPEVVNRMLRQEQLPIWPAEREPLLVWLVVDDIELGRQLASVETHPQVFSALERASTERGLPLIMPVLDLQDRLSLRPEDAWHLNPQALQQASARYQAKHWMVIRFYQTSQGEWRGSSWRGGVQGQSELNNYQNNKLSAFVFDAVKDAADAFSQQYAYIPQATDNSLALVFEGVKSYQGFKDLRNSLQDMEIVSTLRLVELTGDQLKIDVAIEGDSQVFFSSLERDARFQQVSYSGTPSSFNTSRRFRWLGE